MASSPLGPTLVGIGILLVVVGLIAWAGGLSWFGRLPGDIRIETAHSRIYIPLVSMLVASVVVSVLLNLLGRFFRR